MSSIDAIFGSHPRYWREEASGKLEEAVEKFFSGSLLSDPELERLRLYCSQWIHAGCWQEKPGATDLADLRRSINNVTSKQELKAWLKKALLHGIDPF